MTLADNLKQLPANCFNNCILLNNLSIPSSVTTIGNACFYNCKALSLSQLPAFLQTIGSQAFMSCSKVGINDLSSVTNIGFSAFSGAGIDILDNLPDKLKLNNEVKFISALNLNSNKWYQTFESNYYKSVSYITYSASSSLNNFWGTKYDRFKINENGELKPFVSDEDDYAKQYAELNNLSNADELLQYLIKYDLGLIKYSGTEIVTTEEV